MEKFGHSRPDLKVVMCFHCFRKEQVTPPKSCRGTVSTSVISMAGQLGRPPAPLPDRPVAKGHQHLSSLPHCWCLDVWQIYTGKPHFHSPFCFLSSKTLVKVSYFCANFTLAEQPSLFLSTFSRNMSSSHRRASLKADFKWDVVICVTLVCHCS